MDGLLIVVLISGILVLLMSRRRAGAKSVTLPLPSLTNLAVVRDLQQHPCTNFAFSITTSSASFNHLGEIRPPAFSSKRITHDSKTAVSIGPQAPVIIAPAQTRVAPVTVVEPQQPIRIAPRESTLVEPARTLNVTIRPVISALVEPPQRGAWDERGWRRQVNGRQEIYDGTFQVINRRHDRRLSYPGRVINNRGQISAYISSPPPEIKKHPHGACFQLTRDGWFQLHWSQPAQNPDDAILYMERVLDESINH